MVEIFYKPSALRVIKKFNNQEKELFKQTLEQIRQTPEKGGFLTGSFRGLRKWKFKVNGVPYRVVYELITTNRVDIIKVGKRKDFYESF